MDIQNMFAEMGLATHEQREKYAETLSLDANYSQPSCVETKICSNTLSNPESYA